MQSALHSSEFRVLAMTDSGNFMMRSLMKSSLASNEIIKSGTIVKSQDGKPFSSLFSSSLGATPKN